MDYTSPLACYFSVRLPEGGVGNLPVVKGRAYERPEADMFIMVTLQQSIVKYSKVYHSRKDTLVPGLFLIPPM